MASCWVEPSRSYSLSRPSFGFSVFFRILVSCFNIDGIEKTQIQEGELFDQIVEHKQLPYLSRFSEPEVQYVFKQMITGLSYVHSQNIVHRDLKPENILVKRRTRLLSRDQIEADPRWRELMQYDPKKIEGLMRYDIKLSDFGLSKLIGDGYSIATTKVGTQQYWAPEVAHGQQKNLSAGGPGGYSFPADWWSMGVIMYVMLVGRYPFEGQNMSEKLGNAEFQYPRTANKQPVHISGEAKVIISNLLKKNPTERWAGGQCSQCQWVNLPIMFLNCDFWQLQKKVRPMKRMLMLDIEYDEQTQMELWRYERVANNQKHAFVFKNAKLQRVKKCMDEYLEKKRGEHKQLCERLSGGTEEVTLELRNLKHQMQMDTMLSFQFRIYYKKAFCIVFDYIKIEDIHREQRLISKRLRSVKSANLVKRGSKVKSDAVEYRRYEDPQICELMYKILPKCY